MYGTHVDVIQILKATTLSQNFAKVEFKAFIIPLLTMLRNSEIYFIRPIYNIVVVDIRH